MFSSNNDRTRGQLLTLLKSKRSPQLDTIRNNKTKSRVKTKRPIYSPLESAPTVGTTSTSFMNGRKHFFHLEICSQVSRCQEIKDST